MMMIYGIELLACHLKESTEEREWVREVSWVGDIDFCLIVGIPQARLLAGGIEKLFSTLLACVASLDIFQFRDYIFVLGRLCLLLLLLLTTVNRLLFPLFTPSWTGAIETVIGICCTRPFSSCRLSTRACLCLSKRISSVYRLEQAIRHETTGEEEEQTSGKMVDKKGIFLSLYLPLLFGFSSEDCLIAKPNLTIIFRRCLLSISCQVVVVQRVFRRLNDVLEQMYTSFNYFHLRLCKSIKLRRS